MKAGPVTGKGPVFSALVLDTCGTEVQVSEKYVAMLDKAAKSVAEYRKRYDTYAVYQQAAWNQFSLHNMSHPQLLHLFEACKMDLDALEDMTEEEKAAKAEAYKAAVAAVDEDTEAKFAAQSADKADAQQDELDCLKLTIKFEKYKALVIEQKKALIGYGNLAVVDPD